LFPKVHQVLLDLLEKQAFLANMVIMEPRETRDLQGLKGK